MKERPILFSGPMVRAILEGRKTQTRMVVTGRVALEWLAPGMFTPEYVASPENHLCPFGVPGDRLWVRETWCPTLDLSRCEGPNDVTFRATADDADECLCDWRSPILMPRWASRLTLEVVAVRVERLQEISGRDAMAEGVITECEEKSGEYHGDLTDHLTHSTGGCHVEAFERLWDEINFKRASWYSNPWVWVVTFKVVA